MERPRHKAVFELRELFSDAPNPTLPSAFATLSVLSNCHIVTAVTVSRFAKSSVSLVSRSNKEVAQEGLRLQALMIS